MNADFSNVKWRLKISVTAGLITKIDLSAKIAEVENKIAGVADLIKKTVFGGKPNDISNRLTSNEKQQIETGKKVNDHIASYTNS